MNNIEKRLRELEEMVEANPRLLPLKDVADFLGVNAEGLKAALMRKNVPFGFAYQKADGGYRVPVIPTVPFYLWYTNQNGRNVMAGEENLYKEEGA